MLDMVFLFMVILISILSVINVLVMDRNFKAKDVVYKESFNDVINHIQAMSLIYRRSKELSNEPLSENDTRLLEKIDKDTLRYYFNKNKNKE